MVTSDHDWRGHFAAPYQLVEPQARSGSVPVTKPADPRWQTLVLYPFLRHAEPPGQTVVVREQVGHGPVRGQDVGGIAGECSPPERSLPIAEHRTDESRDESRVRVRAVEPTPLRASSQAVAVVEDDRSGLQKPHHGLAVAGP